MNERIQELAEKARIKDHWSVDENRYLTDYLDEEKFAELIVKECMGLFASNPTEDMRVQLADAQARDIIKAHFGVE